MIRLNTKRFRPFSKRWLLAAPLIIVLLGLWVLRNDRLAIDAVTWPLGESDDARALARELSRSTFLSSYKGAYDIDLEVLYATSVYFDIAVGEEGAARHAPEKFYVFLISETVHEGELSETPPPVRLQVAGLEVSPFEVTVLMNGIHHRTSVVRFARISGSAQRQEGSQALKLLIVDAEPLRWALPIVYPKGIRRKIHRLSLVILPSALAGILAALGPCLIQLVLFYMATLTGVGMEVLEDKRARAAARRRILRTAAFFTLGFTVVYTTGGVLAGVIGRSLQSLGAYEAWKRPLSIAAGAVMLLLGWRVAVNARAPLVCRLPLASKIRSERGTGPWGSLMTGMSFAFGCLSCFGATVLTVLLLYVGTSGSVLQGALIMLVFSLGVSVPFLGAVFALERIVPWLTRFEKAAPWLGLSGGMVMMGFGVLMVTNRFHTVSSFIYRWFFSG